MSKPRDDRQKDLLLPALDQIIDMAHPLVRLATLIDWNILDERFSSVCQTGSGQPGLPTRLVAGLFILKHMHNLSGEYCAPAGSGTPIPSASAGNSASATVCRSIDHR